MIKRLKELKDEARDKFRKEVFEQYMDGNSVREIAAYHETTEEAIYMHLRATEGYSEVPKNNLTEEKVEYMIEVARLHYIDGVPMREIAKTFPFGDRFYRYPTIYTFCCKYRHMFDREGSR